MNNAMFFNPSNPFINLLTEENTLAFSNQSRSLTNRRRSSITPSLINDNPRGANQSHSRYKSFSFDHLSSMVQDLFVAGTDTISNTLDWAILYATYYPEQQDILFKEINHVLGKEKLPTESDRFKLPYVEAFINETMRYHCAGPILVPKSTTCDVTFKGYQIPENTFIMCNMWSCMRDPIYWTNPDKFEPKRFVKDGKFYCKNPAMLPFSIGKRACTGESIARLQMFLIFTSLLQKFSFSFTNSKDYSNAELLRGVPGIGLRLSDVSLKFKLR